MPVFRPVPDPRAYPAGEELDFAGTVNTVVAKTGSWIGSGGLMSYPDVVFMILFVAIAATVVIIRQFRTVKDPQLVSGSLYECNWNIVRRRREDGKRKVRWGCKSCGAEVVSSDGSEPTACKRFLRNNHH